MEGSLVVAAALLLVAAGLAKLYAPGPAVTMLHRLWPPRFVAAGLIRGIGAGEVAVALLAIGFGNRAGAVALAAWYLAFTGVTVQLMRRSPATPCGCFGRAESPVGVAHVVQNLVCAVVAAVAVVRPPGWFGGLLDAGPLTAVTGGAQALLLAYLGFLSITALPALGAARRQLEAQ
jgi:hypothetical protein